MNFIPNCGYIRLHRNMGSHINLRQSNYTIIPIEKYQIKKTFFTISVQVNPCLLMPSLILLVFGTILYSLSCKSLNSKQVQAKQIQDTGYFSMNRIIQDNIG